jgi:hypothetical protein
MEHVRYKLMYLLLLGVIFLLASCSTTPNTTPTGNPLEFEPVPRLGVQTQSSSLAAWSPKWYVEFGEDFDTGLDTVVEVDVLGTGLGSRFGATSQASVNIPDPDSVTKLYAQIVFKAGSLNNPSNEFIAPDEIVLSTPVESQSLSAGELSLVPLTDDAGVVLDNTGRVYETVLQPASQVSVDITNIRKFGNLYTPRALIIYVFREVTDYQQGTMSTGRIVNRYLHGYSGFEQASETLDIAPLRWASYDGDVYTLEVTFTLAELGSDPRHVTLVAEAGGVQREVTLEQPTDGNEFSRYTLTLPGVPSGTDEVTATVISPKAQPGESVWNNGDSVFWHAINVMQPYLRACDYVWLTAQADVDAALPCTEAISGVTLGSSVVPDPIDPITNVYNLRNLRNAWTLKVYNTALKDFRGLENARIVGAYKEVMIDISGNAHLERLTELNIDPNSFGFVFIRNNPELTTLEGLYGLQETQGLIIGNNDSLTTLEGIETLIDPGLYMIIEDNASLADITALQSIPPASTFAATIEDNPELDCTLTPLPSFLPLQSGDRSTGNLVNCPLTP